MYYDFIQEVNASKMNAKTLKIELLDIELLVKKNDLEQISNPVFFETIEWLFIIAGGLTFAYMTKLFICIFVEKNQDAQLQNKYDANTPIIKHTTEIITDDITSPLKLFVSFLAIIHGNTIKLEIKSVPIILIPTTTTNAVIRAIKN